MMVFRLLLWTFRLLLLYICIEGENAGGFLGIGIFLRDTLDHHEIQDFISLAASEKLHLKETLQKDSVSNRTPHYTCGPTSEGISKLEALQEPHSLDSIVHIAHVDHSSGTVCFLSLISLHTTSEKGVDKWSSIVVPSVLKIHPSVFGLFHSPDPASNTAGRSRKLLNSKTLSLVDAALVIQVYPAAMGQPNLRAAAVIRDLLEAYIQGESFHNTGTGSSTGATGRVPVLSDERTGGGTWLRVRRKALETAGDHPCKLPASSELEYEGDFVRIVDLRDFSGSGAGCLARLVEVAAADSRVLSVTVEERPVLLNYAARGVLQSGTAGVEPYTAAGLTGEGEVVGVADSGLNDLSCFFADTSNAYASDRVTRSDIYNIVTEAKRRKVIQYVANADGADDMAGHGTHVCGSVAGACTDSAFAVSNGAASGSKIAFFDLQVSGSTSVTIPDLYQYVYGSAYNAGARVLSNSWGSSSSGGYTSRSYASDLFVYTRKDALLVFAAGNTGAEDGESSNFNPCISKNVLCVGSTNLRNDLDDLTPEDLEISYFSSLGPTFDGRIKPDVVGPGFKIVSALSGDSTTIDSTCGVTEIQGTSMSAPLLAGVAVIARQYFSSSLWTSACRQEYGFCRAFSPSGYLLKGLLIHSGRRVNRYSNELFDGKTDIDSMNLGSPPDFFQGYGQVTLTNVLPVAGHGTFDLYVLDEFLVSSQRSYRFEVVVTALAPLKATLVWYDVPSAVGSTSSLLINNLDLCVLDTYGKKWLGNDVSAGGSVDYKNPQEVVHIPEAPAGTYYVYVSASTLVANQNQLAAIIITSQGYVSQGPQAVESVPSGGRASAASIPSWWQASNPEYEELYALQLSFSRNLMPMQPTCIKSFNVDSASFVLSTVKVSLDSKKTSGTAAFLLAVLLTSPSGLTVQVGGYYSWSTNDRIWSRSWPITWTGQRAGEGSYWEASRSLNAMNLQETGRWYVCLQLMYSGWNSTYYSGEVAVTFRRNVSMPTAMPTPRPPRQPSPARTPVLPKRSSFFTRGSWRAFGSSRPAEVVVGLLSCIIVVLSVVFIASVFKYFAATMTKRAQHRLQMDLSSCASSDRQSDVSASDVALMSPFGKRIIGGVPRECIDPGSLEMQLNR